MTLFTIITPTIGRPTLEALIETLRTIWTAAGERLGVDRFEAVGDDITRRAPYETMDNNCLVFARELGVGAAWMYRETRHYNDDRLMYEFLKKYAGPRGRTDRATIHQICRDRLIDMFRSNCSADWPSGRPRNLLEWWKLPG